jgi:hypothetical protein
VYFIMKAHTPISFAICFFIIHVIEIKAKKVKALSTFKILSSYFLNVEKEEEKWLVGIIYKRQDLGNT